MAKGKGLSGLVRQVGQQIRSNSGGEVVGSDGPKIFNILDYIEQPWGLNMTLYPAQRFIVKLYYGLELDNTLPEDPNQRIQVTDMFKSEVKYEFSEVEYLHYLFSEGRCNIGIQDHNRRELVMPIGRRAGKTTLSGIFASYEIYRLLNLYNPQSYYGLPNGNRIQIVSVATGREQAGLLFNEVTAHLAKCEYFTPFIANNTLSHVNFRTPYDIEKFGPTARQQNGKFVSFNGKATLRVTFNSCIAKGLRGHGNIVIILDEVAHFQDKGNSSAQEVYNAVTPSSATYTYKDPKTHRPALDLVTGREADVESRIILISSPLGRSGLFYDRYDLAMRRGEGSENILAIQAPTWEINPTLTGAYYKQKYHENPPVFMVEHGAQFSNQTSGWIERESDLIACIRSSLRPKRMAAPRQPHQMGIDVGLVRGGDGTTVAITHTEEDRIVLDYHEGWYAGIDWRETNPHLDGLFSVNYARRLAEVDRLDFDEIAEWIKSLCQKFHITAGLFDRWNGIPLEQALHKKGLKQFKSEFFPRDTTSKIYQTVKMTMYDQKLVLYDYPIPERTTEGSKHSPLITELLSLQATQVSKNMVIVEAPNRVGSHDDFSDALVRSVWLSTEVIMNRKHTSHGTPYHPVIASAMTPQRYQLSRARRHGISDRSLIGRSIVRPR